MTDEVYNNLAQTIIKDFFDGKLDKNEKDYLLMRLLIAKHKSDHKKIKK